MLLLLIIINSVSSQINQINRTHFICDTNKTLHMNNFNDDFCDCDDGTDENRTNACINGKFYCKNRFYESKVISSSKVYNLII
jgi:hypothetical protein